MVLNIALKELDNPSLCSVNIVKHSFIQYGLCSILTHAIYEVYNAAIIDRFIYDFIPLFNKENAIKYGKSRVNYAYWWSTYVDDGAIEDRKAFVRWMIRELKYMYRYPIIYWISRVVFKRIVCIK